MVDEKRALRRHISTRTGAAEHLASGLLGTSCKDAWASRCPHLGDIPLSMSPLGPPREAANSTREHKIRHRRCDASLKSADCNPLELLLSSWKSPLVEVRGFMLI